MDTQDKTSHNPSSSQQHEVLNRSNTQQEGGLNQSNSSTVDNPESSAGLFFLFRDQQPIFGGKSIDKDVDGDDQVDQVDV
ncbi:hypothetical protein ACH5RR_012674 [Cinchona calisaya]|uniref:Uncharacterized protein n=1 Tax=Cinchona calisaya TaxID=153742 RepID=A0ABD3AE80_9GENT